MAKQLSKKEAIEYLAIPEKNFNNYTEYSGEIKRNKPRRHWEYKLSDLDRWKKRKLEGTVELTLAEYKQCVVFAVRMAYSQRNSHGTGIRGARSEIQMTDDFIMGILGEYGFKKFLKKNFNKEVKLDTRIHPDRITPQDIIKIKKGANWVKPKTGISIKSSKMKSCFNIIPKLEYEDKNRKSDYYIFTRVDLPTDHLFRLFRNHELLLKINKKMEKSENSITIEKLPKIKVWICGYNGYAEFRSVNKIPGLSFGKNKKDTQEFRYVTSVAEMKYSKADWKKLIKAMGFL